MVLVLLLGGGELIGEDFLAAAERLAAALVASVGTGDT